MNENLIPFKPGESGNPKGRPKGSISIGKLIRQVWEEEITDAEGNKKVKVLLSIKALTDKCEEGDVAAFRELVTRMEGLPKQKIEHSGALALTDWLKDNTEDSKDE